VRGGNSGNGGGSHAKVRKSILCRWNPGGNHSRRRLRSLFAG
jgi:hypothetical protein